MNVQGKNSEIGLVGPDGRPVESPDRKIAVPMGVGATMLAQARAKIPPIGADVKLHTGTVLHYLGDGWLAGARASAGWQEGEFSNDPKTRGMRVLCSVGYFGDHGVLAGVTLSYGGHDPTWREIVAVRTAFFIAGQRVMMVPPRTSDYVNVHEHTFQLWEMPKTYADHVDTAEFSDWHTYRVRGDPRWEPLKAWRYAEYSDFVDVFTPIPIWKIYTAQGRSHALKFYIAPKPWKG